MAEKEKRDRGWQFPTSGRLKKPHPKYEQLKKRYDESPISKCEFQLGDRIYSSLRASQGYSILTLGSSLIHPEKLEAAIIKAEIVYAEIRKLYGSVEGKELAYALDARVEFLDARKARNIDPIPLEKENEALQELFESSKSSFRALFKRAREDLLEVYQTPPKVIDDLPANFDDIPPGLLERIKFMQLEDYDTVLDWTPLPEVMNLFNRIYYRFLKIEFTTAVSSAPDLAYANAVEFFEYLKSLPQETIPRKIRIMDIGIGNCRFASFFLYKFRFLCRKQGFNYFNRLEYYLIDGSETILNTAKKNTALKPYGQQLHFVHLQGDSITPSSVNVNPSTVLYIRFNELLTDLPAEFLKKDKGNLYRLIMRMKMDKNIPIKASYGRKVPVEFFAEKLKERNWGFLSSIKWDALRGGHGISIALPFLSLSLGKSNSGRIKKERAYRKIDPSTLYGQSIIESIMKSAPKRIGIPIPTEASRLLESLNDFLHKDGYIDGFDYGFRNMKKHISMSQNDASYQNGLQFFDGLQPTVGLNIPYLHEVANSLGLQMVDELQDDYVKRWITEFSPSYEAFSQSRRQISFIHFRFSYKHISPPENKIDIRTIVVRPCREKDIKHLGRDQLLYGDPAPTECSPNLFVIAKKGLFLGFCLLEEIPDSTEVNISKFGMYQKSLQKGIEPIFFEKIKERLRKQGKTKLYVHVSNYGSVSHFVTYGFSKVRNGLWACDL